jgi:hypothetical protein
MMTALLLTLSLLLGQLDAYAQRRRDYWHDRWRHGRIQSVELDWYGNASKAWRQRYAFWSSTQKASSRLEILSILTLLVHAASL